MARYRYPYFKPADELGHRPYFSDSSQYDEKCATCGRTDDVHSDGLSRPCPRPVSDEEFRREFVRITDGPDV